MAAASAGAFAAVVIDRGEAWKAILMLAPVYATYRTYQLFISRLDLLERERAARASAERGEPAEGSVPGNRLARAAHAAERHPRLVRHPAPRRTRSRSAHDRAFRAIHDSARRQAQLIDELLDVSRIMSGKLRLELSPAVDVNEVVAERARNGPAGGRRQAHPHRRSTRATRSARSARTARGVQQIVWNLLTNAIKFSPDGGAVRVGISRDAVDGGVPGDRRRPGHRRRFPAARIRLVPPGRRLDDAAAGRPRARPVDRQASGRTPTAAASRSRAPAKGVARPSSSGCRSSRSARRRRTQRPPVPRRRGAGADEADRRRSTGSSVLVVDDDDESRAIVTEYLEGQHAVVMTASSAEQALDVLERRARGRAARRHRDAGRRRLLVDQAGPRQCRRRDRRRFRPRP